MATLKLYSHATLATVIAFLNTENIASTRIVSIDHDGSLYNAVYTVA